MRNFYNTSRMGDLTEIFKDVKDYEGAYQISNFGSVRSFLHWDGDGKSERILTPFNNRLGYPMVYLYSDGKPMCKKVHRLVAEAFLENPENHPHINHKDSNRANYHVSNLEFCSVSYNMLHAYRSGGRVGAWTGKKMSAEHRQKMSKTACYPEIPKQRRLLIYVQGLFMGVVKKPL